MGDKMEKLEYAFNLLEHGSREGENILLTTICNTSPNSHELLLSEKDPSQYEIKTNEHMLQYRLVNTSNVIKDEGLKTEGNASAQEPFQTLNNKLYVIGSLTNTGTCLINPKVDDMHSTAKKDTHIGPTKKRDEKRRASHNEVERRRRDKINQWIFKLKDLLPENGDCKNKATNSDSKGGILIKACEYIKNMQQNNESLLECLKNNEKLSLENKLLKEINEKLKKENERLTVLIDDRNIKHEIEYQYESS